MLNRLRKYAGLQKIFLALIIVPFVLFFGYSGIEQMTQGSAMKVNGTAVSFEEYQLFYDQQQERFRQTFSGEMPDFVLQSIQGSTQRQIAQRKMMAATAHSLGLDVTDKELANWIIKNFKDESGQFDPISYKNYLNYFQQEHKLSYEELLKEDLKVQKLQEWLAKSRNEIVAEKDSRKEEMEWTFEAEGKKVGPITMDQYQQLFGGSLDLADYAAIFRLEPGKTFTKEREGKKQTVKLLRKKRKAVESPPQNTPSVGDLWMAKLFETVKIKSYLPK